MSGRPAQHPPIYTIGYGKRSVKEMADLLKSFGVAWVVDVRSKPGSSYKPEFSREPLSNLLAREGLRYLFMGDSIGGVPDDPEVLTGGAVDYERLRRRPYFIAGMDRLRKGLDKGIVMALMCSEGKPEGCHRCRLIGEVLAETGVALQHIDENDRVISQEEAVRRLTGGQQDLFGGAPRP